MPERPHSRYTREKTWAALYSQHINAGYALVPNSTTSNSIDVIRCESPEKAQALMQELYEYAKQLKDYQELQREKSAPARPAILEKARRAVVLARSSDYYHYHLAEHHENRLIICGLHDSYLHRPVWETRTNKRYGSRETAVPLGSPEFARIRSTQFGHNILVGALVNGDKAAIAFLKTLPERTRFRTMNEVESLQGSQYRGRPLAFMTEDERRVIGNKISQGLRRYHANKHLRIV